MSEITVSTETMTDAERDAAIRATRDDVAAIREDIAATKELIERVMTEVQPTIEALSNHPMAKMFLKGVVS